MNMENEIAPEIEVMNPLKRHIRIVAHKQEEFKLRVAELEKKIKKEVKVEFLGTRKVEYSGTDGEGEPYFFEVNFAEYNVEVDLQYSMNGYTFFAMIHDEGENPIVQSPDPEAFKRLNLDRVFKCPHCNKTIQNRKTKVYLQKDGEIFAFGSKCASEYFGDSYKYLVKNLGFFKGFEEDMQGFARINKNDVEKFYNTVALAIHAFKIGIEFKKLVEVERYGRKETIEVKAKDRVADTVKWMGYAKDSEKLLRENEESLINTMVGLAFQKDPNGNIPDNIEKAKELGQKEIREKIDALYNVNIFGPDSPLKMDARKVIKDIISGEDFKSIIKYYEETEPKDNFGFNLKTQFTTQGNIGGILVYGIYKYFWDKAKREMEPKEKETWNRFPGEVGTEVKNVKVKLLRFTSFETGFGEKYVYTFVTENREQLTVFFTGKISAHSGYDFTSSNPRGGIDGYFEGSEWIGNTRESDGEFFRTGVKFEAGMEFLIKKAKIKEQKDYKGTPQTTLKLTRANQIWKV